MKRLLYCSIALNLLLLAAGVLAVQRMGGWRYAWLKLRRDTAGLYQNRLQQFEKLPLQAGAVVFLGDSQIALGEWHEWFYNVQNVLNRGISGDYVEGVYQRLPEVLRHQPLKIALWVGVNDLVFGTDPQAIESDYRKLVARIRQESPNTELLLISLAPVNNQIRRAGIDDASIQTVNRSIRQVAADFAIPYVDVYQPLADAAGRLGVSFTDDGMHLNGLGYLVVKNELKRWLVPQ